MVFSVLTVPPKSLLNYKAKIKTVRWQGELSNHFHLSACIERRNRLVFIFRNVRGANGKYCNRRSAFSTFMPKSSFQTRQDVLVTTWVWQIEARMLCKRNDTPGHTVFDEICVLLAHSSYHWASCLQVSNLLC